MSAVFGLTAVLSLLAGLALGWYLRRATSWCPHCGHSLTCSACGHRPAKAGQSRPSPTS
jgi:hypothetical protein